MRRRFTLLPSEKRLYNRQGFLVKERFIPESDIKKASGYCHRLTQRLSGYSHIIGDLPFHQPELISLLGSLNIWKAMSIILGTPRLVYHHSQLIIKPPHSGSDIHWHRDFSNKYISPIDSNYLRVFIPLSDVTLKNGAPLLIPGSNKICDAAVKLIHHRHVKQFPARSPLISHPGDIIFLHPKTLHSSLANHCVTSRTMLVMQVAKATAPLNAVSFEEKLGGLSRLQLIHHQTSIL